VFNKDISIYLSIYLSEYGRQTMMIKEGVCVSLSMTVWWQWRHLSHVSTSARKHETYTHPSYIALQMSGKTHALLSCSCVCIGDADMCCYWHTKVRARFSSLKTSAIELKLNTLLRMVSVRRRLLFLE